MPNPNETIDKEILIDRISLISGLMQYLVSDNPIVDSNPNLKDKSDKISSQLIDLKKHIS